MTNLNTAKIGDKLISKHGAVLIYAGIDEKCAPFRHIVVYENGSGGTRTDDGKVAINNPLPSDHDIVNIIPAQLNDLKDRKTYIGKVVVFNEKTDIMESDFDIGMKARVLGIDLKDDDVWRVYFDFSEFNEYNKARAKPNYYDERGKPTLTWWDKSYFPKNFKCSEYSNPEELHFELCEEEPETVYVLLGSQGDWDLDADKNIWVVAASKDKKKIDDRLVELDRSEYHYKIEEVKLS